jgi:hypothetical protein
MANFHYIDETGNEPHFQDNQQFNLDHANPNFVELSVQDHISRQQIFLPTMHQRHDSIIPCSHSQAFQLAGSQHQADAQPYANVRRTLHSPDDYPQLPVNTCMSRSTSQYSATSTGHRQQDGGPHRASRGSFGSNLPSNASGMVRSYSNASTAQQGAPQPRTTHPCPSANDYHSKRPSDFSSKNSPNYGYQRTARNTLDLGLNFNSDDIIGSTAGIQANSESFDQSKSLNE